MKTRGRWENDALRIVLALAVLALMAAIPVGAQEDAPQAIEWSWHLEPATAQPGSEAVLVLVAKVAPDWVVYSSDFKAELGPLPAKLTRAPNSSLELIDALRSVGAKRKHDASINAEYGYFSKRAELRQRIRLPADGGPIEVRLSGQACYEVNGSCHLIRQNIRIAAR